MKTTLKKIYFLANKQDLPSKITSSNSTSMIIWWDGKLEDL